jgi:hypothetical protein
MAEPIGERRANTLRDYFGTFCAKLCKPAPVCSHLAASRCQRRMEKPLKIKGLIGRSERI